MKMQFSGTNLELVAEAMDFALAEIHNQIATCPDVIEYADELDELALLYARMVKIRNTAYTKLGWATE